MTGAGVTTTGAGAGATTTGGGAHTQNGGTHQPRCHHADPGPPATTSAATTRTATIATFFVRMDILSLLGRTCAPACLPRRGASLTRVPPGAKVRRTGLTVSLRDGGKDEPRTVPPGGRRRPALGLLAGRCHHDKRARPAEARRGDALGDLRDPGPALVRSGRGPGTDQLVLGAVRDARRAREADARQPHDAEPRRVVDRERRPARLRVQAPRRTEVPQRRRLHRRGREVQLPADEGHEDPQGEGARDHGGRSVSRALHAPRAV